MKDNVAAGPKAAEIKAHARPMLGPAKLGSVDIEAFSKNLARMIEGGGKALAAYLKPREEGKVETGPSDEIADMVKTLGQVLEYWLSDPARAVELQSRLGRAYLELFGATAKRLSGEDVKPVAQPDPRDKRFADPEWTTNQFFDFVKQAYLLGTDWAEQLVADAKGLDPHTRQKAEFYVRQIANALSPSNFVLTNPELLRETLTIQRRESRARHADAGGGHRGRRRRTANPAIRCREVRGRHAISRSRPAR